MQKAQNSKQGRWVPTLCWLCVEGPDLVRVHVVDGVAVNIEGNAGVPGYDELTPNQGRVCPKPLGLIQKLYNPYRLKCPMKRTNPRKGRGVDPKWVEISWEEALDTVAEKLKRIRASDSRKLPEINRGARKLSSFFIHISFCSEFVGFFELTDAKPYHISCGFSIIPGS